MNEHQHGLEFEKIGDEFARQLREGVMPSVDDFLIKHPEKSGLRQFLEAIQVVHQLRPNSDFRKTSSSSSPKNSNGTFNVSFPEIADYEILRVVGHGGMGVVYEARQVSLSRRVALKTMRTGNGDSEINGQRFQHEARTAAKLHHSNIVPVYDVGETNDTFYYAMQYIEGRSLDRILKEARRLLSKREKLESDPLEQKIAHTMISNTALVTQIDFGSNEPLLGNHSNFELNVTCQQDSKQESTISEWSSSTSNSKVTSKETLANALSDQSTLTGSSGFRHYCRAVADVGHQVSDALVCAHENGVIHRDIKPSNLLMDVRGHIWVADFGLVKTDNTELTQTGDFVGTLRYMSPERFDGICDARSDVYSLGLTMYEMLAMRPAYDASGQLSLLEKIRTSEPKRLREINPRVPFDLQTIINKAIEKEPKRRYQSARALHEDLARFLDGRPIHARSVSTFERTLIWARRNPVVSTLVMTLAAILIATVIASLYAALAFRTIATVAEDATIETKRNLYFAEMNLAAQATQSPAGIAHIRELVSHWIPAEGEKDFRNWEWTWLNAFKQRSEFTFDFANYDPWYAISGISWSPDGKTIAATCGTNIMLFDWESRKLIGTLKGHEDTIFDVSFSHHGNWLASVGRDRTLRIWDWRTGKQFQKKNHSDSLSAVAWSPDDRLLAYHSSQSFGKNRDFCIYDIQNDKVLHHLNDSLAIAAKVISFSPDGKQLAVPAKNPHQIVIWDVESGSIVKRKVLHDNSILAVDWNPDGSKIVSGSRDKKAYVWDIESDETQLILSHSDEINRVTWSPDGHSVGISCWDGGVRIWDSRTNKIRSISGHVGRVEGISWDPHGSMIATGGEDNVLRVNDLDEAGPVVEINEFDKEYTLAGCDNGLGWQRAGKQLASPNSVYSFATGQLSSTHRGDEFNPISSLISNDGKVVAQINSDGLLNVWDENLQVAVNQHQFEPNSVIESWSHDNTKLVLSKNYPNGSGKSSVVTVWIPGSNDVEPVRLAEHIQANTITDVDWCPDGRRLAISTGMGQLFILDPETNKLIHSMSAQGQLINSISWNHDGSRLAIGGRSADLLVLDTTDWSTHKICRGHHSTINTISWSPDDSRLLSGGDDNCIRLWDANSGTLVFALEREAAVRFVAWDDTGKKIAALLANGNATILDSTLGQMRLKN